MTSTNALASLDQSLAFATITGFDESRSMAVSLFWNMTPPIATPKVCPKERKKEYIAQANGRSALEAEAWTAKDCAEAFNSFPLKEPLWNARLFLEASDRLL